MLAFNAEGGPESKYFTFYGHRKRRKSEDIDLLQNAKRQRQMKYSRESYRPYTVKETKGRKSTKRIHKQIIYWPDVSRNN